MPPSRQPCSRLPPAPLKVQLLWLATAVAQAILVNIAVSLYTTPPVAYDDPCLSTFAELKTSLCGIPAGATMISSMATPPAFSTVGWLSLVLIPAFMVCPLNVFLLSCPPRMASSFIITNMTIATTVVALVSSLTAIVNSGPALRLARKDSDSIAFFYPETFAIAEGGFTNVSGIDTPTPEDIVANRYNGYSFIIPSSSGSEFVTDCDWLLVSPQPIGECISSTSYAYLGCGRFDQLEYSHRCQDAIDTHDIPGLIVSIITLILVLTSVVVGILAWVRACRRYQASSGPAARARSQPNAACAPCMKLASDASSAPTSCLSDSLV